MNQAQIKNLLGELKQLEVKRDKNIISPEELEMFWSIQRELIVEYEKKFQGQERIPNYDGVSFIVDYYPAAMYVRKEARINEPFTDRLVSWDELEESFTIAEQNLGRICARLLQINKRTYYQIRRRPNRDFMDVMLSALQESVNYDHQCEPRELSEEQLSKYQFYNIAKHMIDLYSEIQKKTWARGVVDIDPKILDNYGIYIEKKDKKAKIHMRMIDFSHLSKSRDDYFTIRIDDDCFVYQSSTEGSSVMQAYMVSNTGWINYLAKKYGLGSSLAEYYKKTVAGDSDFERIWPKNGDPIGLHEVRPTGPVLDTRVYDLYRDTWLD